MHKNSKQFHSLFCKKSFTILICILSTWLSCASINSCYAANDQCCDDAQTDSIKNTSVKSTEDIKTQNNYVPIQPAKTGIDTTDPSISKVRLGDNEQSRNLKDEGNIGNAFDSSLTTDEDLNKQTAYLTIDPYEKFNRQMFGFNRAIDKILIKPLAQTYNFILPNFAQKGVSNFFSNLNEIPSMANDILQLDAEQTASNLWRFIINSTVGIGGLFDVATKLGLKPRANDLGLTFAKWGAKNTPYLVLPILGSSTIGDTVALPLNYEFFTIWPKMRSQRWAMALLGVDLISLRTMLLPSDKIIDQAFDPYVAVRNAYLQHRYYQLQEHSIAKRGKNSEL